MLDFSTNKMNVFFNTDEDNILVLDNLSVNYLKHEMNKKAKWCPAVEMHICGENPDDHHFAKHTGSSMCDKLKYVSHKYYPTDDGNKLEFLLSDGRAEVTVHYQFYNEISIVRCWSVVKNIGKDPLGIEYLSSFSYTGFDEGELPVSEKIEIYLPHNAWYREANWKKYSLSDLGYEKCSKISGKRIAVSNTGTWSTKEFLPMGAVTNKESKNTLLWQIESNGSWHWEISDIYNMLYLKLSGPTEQENQWYKELGAGESFESVKCAVALSEDFDGALAEITKYRRKIVTKNEADKHLPVIFNDYMNCLMGNPTEEKLIPIIDKAAAVGAEYFCIDAGWYADGTWWDTVGEWKPCAWRFPHGIKYILDYIRSKGMIPGLWLEIEVMGISCPILDEFDDSCFFVRHGKRIIDHGRYQLDFRNEKVRKFATGIVDRLVGEYGIGYIKNDYNIEAGVGSENGSDSYGDGLLEHNRAYTSWIKEIKAKYPSLIWENCSSGGMRMDYAMLQNADLESASDQTEYLHNARVAAAIATAVLPEQAAIWAYPKVRDSKSAFVMNMVNAMLLRIHLSGQIYGFSDDQLAVVKEAIDCYKMIRNDISGSIPFYPLGIPGYTDKWMCAAYRKESLVRMAIWKMNDDENSISIPFDSDVKNTSVIYPKDFDGQIVKKGKSVDLIMNEPFSAAVFEVQL